MTKLLALARRLEDLHCGRMEEPASRHAHQDRVAVCTLCAYCEQFLTHEDGAPEKPYELVHELAL
jgi:hypothetical protein